MFFVFLPIAGTELYKEVVAAGFKEPTSIQEWVDMDSTSWFYKHDNWIPNSKRREISMIMISSLFCSKSAKSKMTNFWAKIAFTLYHPIAKMRPLPSAMSDAICGAPTNNGCLTSRTTGPERHPT